MDRKCKVSASRISQQMKRELLLKDIRINEIKCTTLVDTGCLQTYQFIVHGQTREIYCEVKICVDTGDLVKTDILVREGELLGFHSLESALLKNSAEFTSPKFPNLPICAVIIINKHIA